MFDTRTVLVLLGGAAVGATALHFFRRPSASTPRTSMDPARVQRLLAEKARLEQSDLPSDKAKLADVVKELASEFVRTSSEGLIKTFEPS